MRDEVAAKFLQFMRARAVGGESSIRSGHFSAMPGQAKPDLFGSLDMLHALYIIDCLDDVTDHAGRRAWIEHLLTYQDADGWFRSHDRQAHGVEHATAYALGGLQILTDGDGSLIADDLRPFQGLRAEIAAHPDHSNAPFGLSPLQKVHFWRGSHRAAGIAAIIGAVGELGLSGSRYIGLAEPQPWLEGWWAYFAARVDEGTGYWSLASRGVHQAFNALYQFRHNPQLATMGGAVHLYWISEKIGAPMPHPAALAATTMELIQANGLYEDEPYCIDLDANFCIARARAFLRGSSLANGGEALEANRAAVLSWFAKRTPEEWNPNSHNVPGAFAAVGEVDRVIPPANGGAWRDIFERTWWI